MCSQQHRSHGSTHQRCMKNSAGFGSSPHRFSLPTKKKKKIYESESFTALTSCQRNLQTSSSVLYCHVPSRWLDVEFSARLHWSCPHMCFSAGNSALFDCPHSVLTASLPFLYAQTHFVFALHFLITFLAGSSSVLTDVLCRGS